MPKTIFGQMSQAIGLLFEGVDVVANELDRIRAVKEELSAPGRFDRAHWERLKREEEFLLGFLRRTQDDLAELMRRIDRLLRQPR